MSNHINEGAVKVIEIIGISSKSFDDAIAQAVSKASKTVKGITGFEVIKHMANNTKSILNLLSLLYKN